MILRRNNVISLYLRIWKYSTYRLILETFKRNAKYIRRNCTYRISKIPTRSQQRIHNSSIKFISCNRIFKFTRRQESRKDLQFFYRYPLSYTLRDKGFIDPNTKELDIFSGTLYGTFTRYVQCRCRYVWRYLQ